MNTKIKIQKARHNVAKIAGKGAMILALALCAPLATLHAKSYVLSADSHIGFEVKKLGMMTIQGQFKEKSGTLELENGTIKSLQGQVVIESIFTDSPKRDKHLLEADFLDSTLAPKGHFVMKSYEALESGADSTKGRIKGTLTLHNVSREIALDSVLQLNGAVRLELTGEINIKDFGISGSFMNANKVKILLQTAWE